MLLIRVSYAQTKVSFAQMQGSYAVMKGFSGQTVESFAQMQESVVPTESSARMKGSCELKPGFYVEKRKQQD